tara:strand:- start:73 stop:594 length:522 start_codon:yes stop_codon:yes gene_type:complete
MAFYSTKTYGHNIGLSAVFRQPNADHSHCHLLHGYSLAFKFTFGCNELDNKNWAVDFGGLKPLKKWLEDHFDHKTCIDADDPHKQEFYNLQEKDLCEVVEFNGVGVEKFAKHAFDFADKLVRDASEGRCWVEQVECSEHGANSAIYTPFSVQKIVESDASDPMDMYDLTEQGC